MLVKRIKYTDFDGNEREEDFLFNLNKAEVFKWLMCNGGYTLDKMINKLVQTARGKDIMDIFESLILMSYGEKSLDGKRFEKSEELSKAFKETNAYSELFMEIIMDAKKAAEFINGIIPSDMAKEIQDVVSSNPDAIPDEVKDYLLDDDDSKVVDMPSKE